MIDGTLSAKTYEFHEIRNKVTKTILRRMQEKRFGEYVNDLFAKATIEVNDEALRELQNEMKSAKPKPSPHNFNSMPANHTTPNQMPANHPKSNQMPPNHAR
jgi:hypothetical protein